MWSSVEKGRKRERNRRERRPRKEGGKTSNFQGEEEKGKRLLLSCGSCTVLYVHGVAVHNGAPHNKSRSDEEEEDEDSSLGDLASPYTLFPLPSRHHATRSLLSS